MAQNYTWPAIQVSATNPSVGTNGQSPSATSSTLVAGQTPGGAQQPLQTDASGNLKVDIASASGSPIAVSATIVSPLASGRVLVDGSQVTQPVSAASLPLPTGASTSALQTTGNTSLASIDTKTPALVSGRVPVDGSGVVQPVSGTVTVTQAIGTNLHTVVDSSALPTGAATAALQISGNASLTSIDSKLTSPLAVTGPLTDTQLRATPVPVSGTVSTSVAGKATRGFVRNDYSTTPVTTAAYVQLIASTSGAATEMFIFDSSGQTLKIAFGAAASEVDQFLVIPGGNGTVPIAVPSGTRISIRAVSATASVGEIDLNLLG